MFFVLRYGLRTNSLMVLGLTLGWIFGILSFMNQSDDVICQLAFGLLNGLQVTRIEFFLIVPTIVWELEREGILLHKACLL